jgi:isopentenyl diphosphate isomerase/L-lactate dehydrogenase-like FMN-dependent dehydrogenase
MHNFALNSSGSTRVPLLEGLRVPLGVTRASRYSALCVTVDLPVLGNRTSLRRRNFAVPPHFRMGNVDTQAEQPTPADDAPGVNLKQAGDRAAYVNQLYETHVVVN